MSYHSQDISSKPRRTKYILFIAQKVVYVEVVNNLLVDDSLKEFADETNGADRSILRRNELPVILEDRTDTFY